MNRNDDSRHLVLFSVLGGRVHSFIFKYDATSKVFGRYSLSCWEDSFLLLVHWEFLWRIDVGFYKCFLYIYWYDHSLSF